MACTQAFLEEQVRPGSLCALHGGEAGVSTCRVSGGPLPSREGKCARWRRDAMEASSVLPGTLPARAREVALKGKGWP